MKKILIVFVAAFVYLALTAGDCNKSTDPNSGPPTIPSVSFSSPGQQDACSQEAAAYISYINAQAGQLSLFASLPPATNGNTFSWQVTLDSLTITVTAVRQGDGSVMWDVKYNGTEDGISYSNKVVLSGSTSGDGQNGDFTAYEDTSTAVLGTLVYSTNSSGVLSGTLTGYDNGTAAIMYEVTSNASKIGGEITLSHADISGWVQDFHATWATNGGQATCD